MIASIVLLLAGAAPFLELTEKQARAQLASAPPAAPGKDETPLHAISDPAVQQCVTTEEKILQKLKWRTVRVLMTASPKFGQLWHADAATKDEPAIVTRLVCSKEISISHPLEMFNPKESRAPLP